MLSNARCPRPALLSLSGRRPTATPRARLPLARRPAWSADAPEPIEELVVRTANSALDPDLKGFVLRLLVQKERAEMEREFQRAEKEFQRAEMEREFQRAEKERERGEKEKLQLLLQDAVLQVMKLQGQLSLRGLFGELIAPGCCCASALSAGADLGRLFASLAEYAEDKAVQNLAVAAALEASVVGGSPGRVQVWRAVFSTEDFAPLLDCITAATNWPAKQVPKKIDALYTHLNNIAHSGFPAVAAQLTDSYLEIPAGAVTGPDTELAVCMASFFGVKYKRVGGWQGGGSLPAEE